MTIQTLIKSGEYHDSVALMLVSRELSALPGVVDVSVSIVSEISPSASERDGPS